MINKRLIKILTIFTLLLPLGAGAQNVVYDKLNQFGEKVDEIQDKTVGTVKEKVGFFKGALQTVDRIRGVNDYDSLYIGRIRKRFTVKAKTVFSGVDIDSKNSTEEIPFKEFDSETMSLGIGASISFKGFELGYTYTPFSQKNHSTTRTYSLVNYGPRFCFDAMLSTTSSMDGDVFLNGEWVGIAPDLLSHRSLFISMCYNLNHRKFSYPAAFSASYIQKKSAGSVLLAGTFANSRYVVHPLEGINQHKARTRFLASCLGGGYGYNYVTPRGWLLHGSAIAETALMDVTRGLLDSPTPFKVSGNDFAVIVIPRLAAIKNFHRDRMYLQFTSYGFWISTLSKNNGVSYSQFRWDTRAVFGYRF